MPTPRVLITAFEPYQSWATNASWLALIELTRELPDRPEVTTRRYPVDFSAMKKRLAEDLQANYDFALHLGQAPGSSWIRLESIGLNIAAEHDQSPEEARPLVPDGPTAYRSRLPLAEWATALRDAGIPARVSYHAGTFLCNATLYLSHCLAEQMGLKTQSAFIHLPLDTSQTIVDGKEGPSLPAASSAAAIRLLLAKIAE